LIAFHNPQLTAVTVRDRFPPLTTKESKRPVPARHVLGGRGRFVARKSDRESTSMRDSALRQSRRTVQTPRQPFGNIGNWTPVFLVVLTVVTFSVMPLSGQTTTGTISGTVIDPAGALIPGAMVSVTNEATGDSRSALTSESGNFSLPSLLPATYTIRVEL